jgi:hypothetical protein
MSFFFPCAGHRNTHASAASNGAGWFGAAAPCWRIVRFRFGFLVSLDAVRTDQEGHCEPSPGLDDGRPGLQYNARRFDCPDLRPAPESFHSLLFGSNPNSRPLPITFRLDSNADAGTYLLRFEQAGRVEDLRLALTAVESMMRRQICSSQVVGIPAGDVVSAAASR